MQLFLLRLESIPNQANTGRESVFWGISRGDAGTTVYEGSGWILRQCSPDSFMQKAVMPQYVDAKPERVDKTDLRLALLFHLFMVLITVDHRPTQRLFHSVERLPMSWLWLWHSIKLLFLLSRFCSGYLIPPLFVYSKISDFFSPRDSIPMSPDTADSEHSI